MAVCVAARPNARRASDRVAGVVVIGGLRRGSVRDGMAYGGDSGTLPPYLVMPVSAMRRTGCRVGQRSVHVLNRRAG